MARSTIEKFVAKVEALAAPHKGLEVVINRSNSMGSYYTSLIFQPEADFNTVLKVSIANHPSSTIINTDRTPGTKKNPYKRQNLLRGRFEGGYRPGARYVTNWDEVLATVKADLDEALAEREVGAAS